MTSNKYNTRKDIIMDKLVDTIIVGGCILTIVVGSVLGAWLLLQTI